MARVAAVRAAAATAAARAVPAARARSAAAFLARRLESKLEKPANSSAPRIVSTHIVDATTPLPTAQLPAADAAAAAGAAAAAAAAASAEGVGGMAKLAEAILGHVAEHNADFIAARRRAPPTAWLGEVDPTLTRAGASPQAKCERAVQLKAPPKRGGFLTNKRSSVTPVQAERPSVRFSVVNVER